MKRSRLSPLLFLSLAFVVHKTISFSPQQASRRTTRTTIATTAKQGRCLSPSSEAHRPASEDVNNKPPPTSFARNRALSAILASTLLLSSSTAMTANPGNAYEPTDFASETVTQVVDSLKRSAGNIEDTFNTYTDIAAIITEGKGVGGAINYKGVQLERGYVADEDTTIYNPGLTLLTESEKERLVEAVIQNRQVGLQKNQWSENNEYAFDFLKEKLDPFHMVELRGYLSIVPIYGAVLYLATLAIQQFARDLFPVAYIVGAIAFFGPIAALIAFGS